MRAHAERDEDKNKEEKSYLNPKCLNNVSNVKPSLQPSENKTLPV